MKKFLLLICLSVFTLTGCSIEDWINGSESRKIVIVNETGVNWNDAWIASYESAVGLENCDPYVDLIGTLKDGKNVKAHIAGDVIYAVFFNEDGDMCITDEFTVNGKDQVVFPEGCIFSL